MFFIISGAEYTIVPIGSLLFSFIFIAQSKPPNLTEFKSSGSNKNILLGLISLCIIPCLFIIFKASAIFFIIFLKDSNLSLKDPFFDIYSIRSRS